MATNPLPNTQIRAAAYARVSTSDQQAEMQLVDIRKYAAYKGWTLAEYVDSGVSGTKEHRPQLDRLMGDVKAGKLDTVIVWKFDRLARNARNLLNAIHAMEQHNVSIVSVQENLDSRTPTGKAMIGMVAIFAEMERSFIVERVNAGLRNAKANGVQLGRRANDNNDAAILALHSQGKSAREISRELDVPLTTVRRRLAGEAL